MSRRIFKYELKLDSVNIVAMPKGAEVISVIEQNNGIMVYAIVDPNETKMEDKVFTIVGTGRDMTFDADDYVFLGTVSMFEGRYIWHVFMA